MSKQIVGAILTAVGIVFAVTFALQVLGKTRGPKVESQSGGAEKDAAVLIFDRTSSRIDPSSEAKLGLESELHVPQHCDFHFTNPTDAPIHAGLKSLSCKCQNALIALTTREYDDWVLGRVGRDVGDGLIGAGWALDGVIPTLARAAIQESKKPERSWQQMEKEGDGLTVPAGASGWVRVTWEGKTPGPQSLRAEVWTRQADNSSLAITPLEIPLLFVEPVYVQPRDVMLDGFAPGSQATKQVYVVSSTRPFFNIIPDPTPDGFVTWSEPVALTAQERAELERKFDSRIQWGYKVSLEARDEVKTGGKLALLDLGPFRRHLTLRTDAKPEPLQVMVIGAVDGNIKVNCGTVEDRIQFGNFSADQGTSATVVIDAAADLQLKLDEKDTLKFLKVSLKEQGPTAFGRKGWKLQVEVPANQAAGDFPRQDDPELKDCAIYLVLQEGRRLRIPVSGTATFR